MSLYKIGGSYFVADGNHRVSVARYHGIEWIHAQVTEFRVPSPVQAVGVADPSRSRRGIRGPTNHPREETRK